MQFLHLETRYKQRKAKEQLSTYQVEVKVIFENAEALDNVVMLNAPQYDYLCGQLPGDRVIHPGMIRDLFLDNELDSDFVPPDAVVGRHDKTVTSRTQLILQLVLLGKFGVQMMVGREKGRVTVSLSVVEELRRVVFRRQAEVKLQVIVGYIRMAIKMSRSPKKVRKGREVSFQK